MQTLKTETVLKDENLYCHQLQAQKTKQNKTKTPETLKEFVFAIGKID